MCKSALLTEMNASQDHYHHNLLTEDVSYIPSSIWPGQPIKITVNIWVILGFLAGLFLVFNRKDFPGIWHVSCLKPMVGSLSLILTIATHFERLSVHFEEPAVANQAINQTHLPAAGDRDIGAPS